MAERHDDGVRGQTFGFVDGHHADTATLLFGWQRGLRERFVPILQKITQIGMAFVEIIVQVIHEGEEIFAFVAEILSGIFGIKGQVSVNGVHHFGERQLREAFAFGFEIFKQSRTAVSDFFGGNIVLRTMYQFHAGNDDAQQTR